MASSTYAERIAACRHQIGGRLFNGLNVQIGYVCGACLQPMPLGPANDRGVLPAELRLADALARVTVDELRDSLVDYWQTMDGVDRDRRRDRTHRAEAMRARRRR